MIEVVGTVTAESDLVLTWMWDLLGFTGPLVTEALIEREASVTHYNNVSVSCFTTPFVFTFVSMS